MRTIARIATALAVAVVLASVAAAGTDTHARHNVKHPAHVARHPHVRHHPGVIYGQPVGPPGSPGHRYGGPLYSTCDRINADRMLVGTCR